MRCECDNCGHECDEGQLNDIRHLEQRLDYPLDDPRCIVPAGECPRCGCLAYPVEPDANVTPVARGSSPRPLLDGHLTPEDGAILRGFGMTGAMQIRLDNQNDFWWLYECRRFAESGPKMERPIRAMLAFHGCY